MSSAVADSTSVNIARICKQRSSHTLCCRFPSQNLEIDLYTKPEIHSGGVRLVFLSLKYPV